MTDRNDRKEITSTVKGTRCRVCNHPQREEFDRALVAGTVTQVDVAQEVGCSPTSVWRHVNNHLLPEARTQFRADPELGDVDVLSELQALYSRMKEHLGRAEDADNWQAIRAFHAEARRDLELLAKLIGELDERPQVNVLLSPQWVLIRTTLMTALRPFPDARAAAARALLEVDGADSD
jgi:hypothetical protein